MRTWRSAAGIAPRWAPARRADRRAASTAARVAHEPTELGGLRGAGAAAAAAAAAAVAAPARAARPPASPPPPLLPLPPLTTLPATAAAAALQGDPRRRRAPAASAPRGFASSAAARDGVRAWNALTRRADALVAPADGVLTLYVCGPTVYDSPHLGHARTYVCFDAIRRVLRRSAEVVLAVNVTDVDDKILARARANGESRQALSARYEAEFFAEMARLGVERPTLAPRATDYIAEMLDMIRRLRDAGVAYRAPDGSVYLSVRRVDELVGYPGSMAPGRGLPAGQAAAAAGVGGGAPSAPIAGEDGKRDANDFALWKAAPADADADAEAETWDAEPVAGRGRPGWHLECSAMVDATVGRVRRDGRVDVHGGGVDLCFPHHCNERAQSQVLLALRGDGREWSPFFLHTGHVTANAEKMSKSLGNFVTLQSALRDMSPRVLRLLLLSNSKYNVNMEWSEGAVDRARALDATLAGFLAEPARPRRGRDELRDSDAALLRAVAGCRAEVEARLADDFDFPGALDAAHRLVKEARRAPDSCFFPAAQDAVLATLELLGFGGRTGVRPGYQVAAPTDSPSEAAGGAGAGAGSAAEDALLDAMVAFRAQVRAAARAKDVDGVMKACDAARAALKERFRVVVEDSAAKPGVAAGARKWFRS